MRSKNTEKWNIAILLTRTQETVLTDTPLCLFRSSMGLLRPQDKACQQEGFESAGLEPNFGLLSMTIHSHTPFHLESGRWLDPVLSQNAEELGRTWVRISFLQQNYVDKGEEKASVPALFFSPLRWNRFRSSAFLLLYLHLKRADLCPFHPGSCRSVCHIWYLSLHKASLHSAKLFSCSSSRIQRQRPCEAGGADLCYWCQEGADLSCSAMLCNVLLPGSNPVNLSGIKIDEILCCHQALQNTWFSWTAVTQSGNCSQKVRKLLRKESLYCCFLLFEV